MDFNLFPLEIKFMILSHLTQDELQSKVSLVSEEWSELAKSPYLQTEIELDGRFNSEKTLQDLKTNKRIRTVKISYMMYVNWIENIPVSNHVRCVKLHRCNFHYDYHAMQAPSKIVKHFPSIQEVKIIGDWDPDIQHCMKIAEKCPKLKSVDLGHECSSTFGNKFFDTCGKKLEKLTFNYGYVNEKTTQSLSQQCVNLKELRIFYAVGMYDTDFLALKELSRLCVLHITLATTLNRETYVEFFSKPFPNLICLIFEKCHSVTGNALKSIARSCSKLQKLHVTQCSNIRDNGVITIAESCNDLRELNFCGCTNLKGVFLDGMLSKVPKLQYLNLQGCHKVQDLKYLTTFKTDNPKIRIIHPIDNII